MSKRKLIDAPNMKKQDITGEKEIIVYVGSQAWDLLFQSTSAHSIAATSKALNIVTS